MKDVKRYFEKMETVVSKGQRTGTKTNGCYRP